MDSVTNHDVFVHLRTLVGVVTGLSLTRLLMSLARMVQHPGHGRPPALWLGWVAYLLIGVLHFWWFEFALIGLRWTFELYAFTVFYAALFFFVCAVLTPDSIDDYAALDLWLAARRGWFYGLLAGLFLIDLVDTATKGLDHLLWLGPGYIARQLLLAAGAIVAARGAGRRFDAGFLIVALTTEIALIVTRYSSLD